MSDAVNRLRAQVEAPGLRPLAAGLQISLSDAIELLHTIDQKEANDVR